MVFKQKAVKASDEEKYYNDGATWEGSRARRAEQANSRMWLLLGGACFVIIVLTIALAIVVRVPRLIPYVVEFNKDTNTFEMVGRVDETRMVSLQDLIDKNNALNYVIAHEEYYFPFLQRDYDEVHRTSVNAVWQPYSKKYEGADSLDKTLGASTLVEVKPVSVQLTPDAVGTKAVVRFSKQTMRTDGTPLEDKKYFVATLAYEYRPAVKGKDEDLIRNPNGYTVIGYRADQELAPMPTPANASVLTPSITALPRSAK